MRRGLWLSVLLIGVLLIGMGSLALRRSGPPRPHSVAFAAEPQQIISDLPFKLSLPAGSSLTGSTSAGGPDGPAPVGERIRIAELGLDLPVVEGDGYNAPLFKVAHYPGLAWPGQGGRSVLYAHARPGMFAPLFEAKVGQRIDITHPDGSLRRYVISEYYSRWPVSDTRWLQKGDFEQLVLVTCTTYNQNDPRIVVVAKPI